MWNLKCLLFCPEINCLVDCRFYQSIETFLNIYPSVRFDCFLFGCQDTTQCLSSSSMPCTSCHGLHNLSHAPFSINIALGVEVPASSLDITRVSSFDLVPFRVRRLDLLVLRPIPGPLLRGRTTQVPNRVSRMQGRCLTQFCSLLAHRLSGF